MLFSLHAAILANNNSSVTVTETVFASHGDLSVQSQQSRIDSTLSPSQLNSSKLTGRRYVTTTAGLLVRLTNRFLLVFNNTNGQELLHSFKLSSPDINCDPRGLDTAPGVYSSKGVRFPAIVLVECSSRVYGLFGMANGGFVLERRALYLPPSMSVEKTIIQRQVGSVAVFIDGGFVFSGELGATDYQAHVLFRLADIGSSCSNFARLHDQSYDSDRFVLLCADNHFLCTLQGSCTQVHIQSTGEHELDIAFSRDIAVAASSESATVTVYRDSFMQSCSLNVSALKLYLIMTPYDVLLVLFSPSQISTHNITSGCEPNPISSLNINCHSAGCGAPEIFGQYLVVTSSSNTVYNTTIIDIHSSDVLYATYTQLPLAYQLNVRMSMTPPTVPPLPSPSTTHTPALQSPTDAIHFQPSQSLPLATLTPPSPTVSSQSPSAVDNASTTLFATTTSSSLFMEPTTTAPANTNQLMIAAITSVVVLLLAVVVSAGVIICVCMLVHKQRKDSHRQLPTTAEMELKPRNIDQTSSTSSTNKPVQETDQCFLHSYDVAAVQESPPNGNAVYLITDSLEHFQDPTTDLSTQRTSPPPTSPRLQQPPAFRY